MAKKTEKIRIHNQGKREYLIPAATKGGEKRKLLPGRAVEIEADLAKKMIKSYPRDLINFEDLVSGDRRDLNKENRKLASDLSKAQKDNEVLQARIEELEEAQKDNKDNEVLEESTKPQGE